MAGDRLKRKDDMYRIPSWLRPVLLTTLLCGCVSARNEPTGGGPDSGSATADSRGSDAVTSASIGPDDAGMTLPSDAASPAQGDTRPAGDTRPSDAVIQTTDARMADAAADRPVDAIPLPPDARQDMAPTVDAPCAAGGACTTNPGNRCKKGIVSCATGTPECVDGTNEMDGKSCGTDQVCNAGMCVTCRAAVSCSPANPCKDGVTSCSTGTSVCTETTSKSNGSPCPGGVCNNGACTACMANASCAVSNPCKEGKIACTTGSPVCVESNRANGTTCPGGACTNGNCIVCPTGACTFGAGANECKTGTWACPGGVQQCMATGNRAFGDACNGPNGYCDGGVCKAKLAAGSACGPTVVCQDGLSCVDGVCCTQSWCPLCMNCGAAGQCQMVATGANDLTPDSGGPTCSGTRTCGAAGCENCGQPGTLCCAGGSCAAGNYCSGTICSPCGTPGTPCCLNTATPCVAGSICNRGQYCQACGDPGTPCCAASVCNAGATCDTASSMCY